MALDQAGSYIKNDGTGLTISKYRNLFRQTQERLAMWKKDETNVAKKPYSKTVATTWEITMNHIKKNFPDSAEALNLCAFLNANGIPQKWLEDWWKEKKGLSEKLESVLRQELTDLTKPLIDFSLLYWEKSQVLLRIHRLVQLVTQDNLKKEERGEFIREALELVEGRFESYDHKDPGTWEIGKECLPHAVSVTEHILKEKHFLENTNLKKILSIELDPEIIAEERAIFHQEIFHASEQGKTTFLFNQMATYSLRQGNAFQAIEYWTQVLKISKAFYDAHHPSVAGTLNNLGATWSVLSKKKKAIEYFEKALEIYKAFYGSHHPSIAGTLNNLGTTWSDLGEKKKAIEYYEKALEMKKAFLGAHHPSVADTLNNLGLAWSDLGEKKQAIEYFEKALEMKKAFLGIHHPSAADTLNNLGLAWNDLGENKKAIEYYEKALEIYKAFLGAHHPSVADTLHNLGSAWRNLGENKQAIEYYEKALKMKKAFYGSHHPSVANTLNNLGNAWRNLGNNNKAIELCEQSLSIYKSFYGTHHPSVASTLTSLGTAWSILGENKKATQYYEKALEIFKAFLGTHHPSVADTLNNLGNAWSALGEKKQAIEFHEKALEMTKAFYGAHHHSVANILNNLGAVWSSLDEKNKAIKFYTQAHAIFQECYGDNHPHTQGVQANLHRNLLKINSTDKSTNHFIETLLQAFNNTYLTQEPNTTPEIADLFFKAFTQENQSAHQKLHELAAQNDPKAKNELLFLKGYFKQKKQSPPAP